MQIFISYRRDDSQWVARALWEKLKGIYGGHSIFMDVESIRLGKNFPEKIEQELAKADIFLIMIGADWLSVERNGIRRLDDPADYVRLEVEYALNSGGAVIPVLVEGTQMPTESDLPVCLQPLNPKNALPLSHQRMKGDVQRLVEDIGSPEPHDTFEEQHSVTQSTSGNKSPTIISKGDVNITFND